MKERINDKIGEIEGFLCDLNEFKPGSLKEYLQDSLRRAACERIVEKLIEALVDLAFLTAKHLEIKIPEEITDTEIFELLAERKLVSHGLCESLKEAKGMRNWLAHEYGKVDDEIVYEALDSEIVRDAESFITQIKSAIK